MLGTAMEQQRSQGRASSRRCLRQHADRGYRRSTRLQWNRDGGLRWTSHWKIDADYVGPCAPHGNYNVLWKKKNLKLNRQMVLLFSLLLWGGALPFLFSLVVAATSPPSRRRLCHGPFSLIDPVNPVLPPWVVLFSCL